MALLLSYHAAVAQDDESDLNRSILPSTVRYIGFNTNGLLMAVVPFNNIQDAGMPFALLMRRYSEEKNGKSFGLRTGFGVNVSEAAISSFAFQMDIDFRRKLYKNIYYFTGFGGGLSFENNNVTDEISGFFGLRLHWGVEYKLNKILSFSTESYLNFGINTEGPAFQLLPPTFIVAHFNITKK
jgi:hypothetical protein